MTPCYYCETDPALGDACSACIHSSRGPSIEDVLKWKEQAMGVFQSAKACTEALHEGRAFSAYTPLFAWEAA